MNQYLTEYDETLAGESYIDPLGMLVIWSAYGREIFENRVNSISNDVRNYTLNLFNHYLIRRLINDESAVLGRGLVSSYGSKDNLNFKYACLVYLENIFVYSILEKEKQKGVDSAGVLGSYKARREWHARNGNPELVFSHDKDGHILVRQLSLGVSGRYKTPLMEIGFFDVNYHYHLPEAILLWEKFELFVDANDALKELSEESYEHLKLLVTQNSTKPREYFADIPIALRDAYTKAFASSGVVGSYARDFWLELTGLDSGASGALLQVLDEVAANKTMHTPEPQQLLAMARQKEMPTEEQLKMEHIESLELFLADATLMFQLLTTKKAQSLDAALDQWKLYGRDENTLPQGALRVLRHPSLKGVVTGTAKRRLHELLDLANAETLQEQAVMLMEYHTRVMTSRGQHAWLVRDNSSQVKVHARPSRLPKPEDWPVGCWFNTYYITQFKWLVDGYQGGSEE